MKERGKIFGKINVLDFIVILIIIFAIAAGLYYFVNKNSQGGEKTTVYFTVEVEGLTKGFSEIIKPEGSVKDSVKGYYLGVVDSVEPRESVLLELDQYKNEFVESTVDDEETVRIIVRSDNGFETDSKITAEGVEIKVGKEMHIEGKGYVVTGYVVALEAVKKGGE